jgi:hypothetical protein
MKQASHLPGLNWGRSAVWIIMFFKQAPHAFCCIMLAAQILQARLPDAFELDQISGA